MNHQPSGGGASFHGLRQAWGSTHQIQRAARRVLIATAMTSGAVLALFHVWLFWDRLASGRLFENGSAARWLAAALLCGALWALRRQGVSLSRGRQAFTVWLLVVLLHAWSAAAASVPAGEIAGGPARDASAAMLLPVTAAAFAGLTGFLLLASARTRRSPLSRLHFCSPVAAPLVATFWTGPARVPRAPPVSLA